MAALGMFLLEWQPSLARALAGASETVGRIHGVEAISYRIRARGAGGEALGAGPAFQVLSRAFSSSRRACSTGSV